ncbi:hypothetical protein JCM19239_6997 [Vibrio variabilis]|uniref:Cell division protein ZipA n=1 Tax=Vibrio variabilis TaxID=990271 RepID=A0ABQ0JQ87_9VIBR|nr:hypothetical protein JCM19239_6997 [Vibrio variabilis]
MKNKGILTCFCGKMGAGKTTLAKSLAATDGAIYLSEDEWLAAHYPTQINSFEDYIAHSNLIKPFVRKHVIKLLNLGVNVVMDFPANTIKQRAWFIALSEEVGCKHEIYYIDVTDEQCLAQIKKRSVEQPERAQFDTEAVFHHVTQYFEKPTNEELGINIVCAKMDR